MAFERLINNKKGWVAKDMIIAIIVFTIVIGIAYIMVGSMAVEYSAPGIVDSNFAQHYNKFEELNKSVGSMWGKSTQGQSLDLVGTLLPMLQMTFSIVTLIFDVLNPFDGMIAKTFASFATDFGVPTEISGFLFPLILMGLAVAIIFIIINATKYGASKI